MKSGVASAALSINPDPPQTGQFGASIAPPSHRAQNSISNNPRPASYIIFVPLCGLPRKLAMKLNDPLPRCTLLKSMAFFYGYEKCSILVPAQRHDLPSPQAPHALAQTTAEVIARVVSATRSNPICTPMRPPGRAKALGEGFSKTTTS